MQNVYILTFNDSLSIDSFSAGLSKAVARVISSCALEEVASSYSQIHVHVDSYKFQL